MDELDKVRAAMIAAEAMKSGQEYQPGVRMEKEGTIRLDKHNSLYFPASVVTEFSIKPGDFVRVFFTDDHNIVLMRSRDGMDGFKFRKITTSDDYLKLTLPKKAVLEHGLVAGTTYTMTPSSVDVGGVTKKVFVLEPKEEENDE